MDGQEFPALGTQKAASTIIGSVAPGDTGRGRPWKGLPGPTPRVVDRGMRPAQIGRAVRKRNRDVRTQGVHGTLKAPLSPLATSFTPRPTPDKSQNQRQYTDIDRHRSPATTGVGEMESPWNNIEDKSATMVLAKTIEIEQPVAMADVAELGGPAGTGAGGPVVTESKTPTATDGTGASGSRSKETDAPVMPEFCFQSGNNRITVSGPAETGTGGPVGIEKGRSLRDGSDEIGMWTGTGAGGPILAGARFTTVAEVYAPIAGTEIVQRNDVGRSDQIKHVAVELSDSDKLGCLSKTRDSVLCGDLTGNGGHDGDGHIMNPDGIRRMSDTEQMLISSGGLSDSSMEPDPDEGDPIMVGVVGSAAPWYLTGWTNDVEVEFMIDTGCQVTILATSVFDKICDIHPEVKLGLVPCTQRLVSADSSPLIVRGRINLNVIFPGLRCDMSCVVAEIGTDGLLGTEALQSCLPHQLDLRTGQLWADGRSTLQLHHQRSTPLVGCSLITAVVLPPVSEVVAEFSITGEQLGSCALIDPNWELTEEFGVMVGHTLVDATSPSANVLMVNMSEEEVVLPIGSLIGTLVPVLSVSVARAMECVPSTETAELPDYLEDIVRGSHTSLGDSGRQSLRDLLHKYEHVFPAPGEPVTGRSKTVLHEIEINDARPVRCGPRRLAPAGLRREQDCVREMLSGGQIEPSDSPWASPVVLVTKKDGSTRFCVDYRRLNSLTVKDAYPLPRIDDSLRLLGNQQWFSTMDLASGYWQVAMSPDAQKKAAFVTNEGLFQFRVMPFGLCNAPATFERLMDRVLCGMRWSRCLVYLDDVISFGKSVPEAIWRLEEVLARLSDFGLQLKAKKCTFMQTEVGFLGHIVGRSGLACDPNKLSAVRDWHEPTKLKGVRQFIGFVGYYRRFVKDFAKLADPLVSLTRKGVPFVWGRDQQDSFDSLKACLLCAPILGFPTEDDRFVLDTDASLFAIGGVLSQIQNEEEVVIAYASRSLRLSQRRYCTTRREMLAAVVMCTHFRSYLRGSPFTLRTDHSSLRWLQKFKNEDGMLARWYLLLGQFSVTFEYRPGALHNNADGMSRQCGQCKRPDCPVSATDLPTTDDDTQSLLVDQPFATSEMGDSMDADLLPECSGETWVASALMDELTVDLPAPGVGDDLVSDTAGDKMLQTVRSWVVSGVAPPWSECAGLSPELRSWRLQVGNIKVDSEGRLWRRRSPPAVGSQLVIPVKKRRGFIREFHDSLFAGHLGITRTVYRLLDRVYWPGLRGDVRTYIKSCTICIARKSPCPRKVPMGHVAVGHHWERVAMDLLDMSVTTSRGNRYVLVIVDCFTRWTEAFPLPDKTAQSVADAFFNQVVCRFGMPAVIHSDQGREFENKILQELCLMGGSHKTRTAPYHPESDGMVERFNRTLLMMLAMFAGKNRDDWDDLLPAVMMAYRSSVHESTGYSPYRLMFGEECTLPMDIGLPREQSQVQEELTSPYAIWVRDALEEAYEQVRLHSGQAVQRQKRLYDRRAVKRIFSLGDWVMRYYAPAKKCKLDSPWTGPYLVVSFLGWTLGIQKDPNSPIVMIHCQDAKKVPAPPGAVSWLTSKESSIKPSVTVLGASTMHRTRPSSLSLESDPSNVKGAVTGDRSVRDGDVSMTSSVDVSSATLISVHSGVDSVSVELDSSCVIHPFYVHKMDSGPVRLMTIAHAFNYRVAVLRDGVKSALRVGRSRKAERCFMINADIPWGQQVAVMFQIVSTLMADAPGFALVMMELRGMQPHIQLMDDTWGHDGKCVKACDCLLPDRAEAFVHCLIPPLLPSGPIPDTGSIDSTMESAGFTFRDDCGYLGVGRPGSIPFVSERPGAYGRLLLAVYVRWMSGLLISSDWLRPVTRGAWRGVPPDQVDEPDPTPEPGESS